MDEAGLELVVAGETGRQFVQHLPHCMRRRFGGDAKDDGSMAIASDLMHQAIQGDRFERNIHIVCYGDGAAVCIGIEFFKTGCYRYHFRRRNGT